MWSSRDSSAQVGAKLRGHSLYARLWHAYVGRTMPLDDPSIHSQESVLVDGIELDMRTAHVEEVFDIA